MFSVFYSIYMVNCVYWFTKLNHPWHRGQGVMCRYGGVRAAREFLLRKDSYLIKQQPFLFSTTQRCSLMNYFICIQLGKLGCLYSKVLDNKTFKHSPLKDNTEVLAFVVNALAVSAIHLKAKPWLLVLSAGLWPFSTVLWAKGHVEIYDCG